MFCRSVQNFKTPVVTASGRSGKSRMQWVALAASLTLFGFSPAQAAIVKFDVAANSGSVSGFVNKITGWFTIDTALNVITAEQFFWDGPNNDGLKNIGTVNYFSTATFGPNNRYTELYVQSPFTSRDYFDLVLDFGGAISSYAGGNVNGAPTGTNPPTLPNQFGYGFGCPDSCVILNAGRRNANGYAITDLTFIPETAVVANAAVPEPTTSGLVIVSLAGIGLIALRRNGKYAHRPA